MRLNDVRLERKAHLVESARGGGHLLRVEQARRARKALLRNRGPMEDKSFGLLRRSRCLAVPWSRKLERLPIERALLAQNRQCPESITAV